MSKLAQNLLNRFPKYKYELIISNLPRNIILENEDDLHHTQNELDLIQKINKSKKNIWIFSYLETRWFRNI